MSFSKVCLGPRPICSDPPGPVRRERDNPDTVWRFPKGTGSDFQLHPGNLAWNNTQLFESIPDSMFFSLLNLFGAVPMSRHSLSSNLNRFL